MKPGLKSKTEFSMRISYVSGLFAKKGSLLKNNSYNIIPKLQISVLLVAVSALKLSGAI